MSGNSDQIYGNSGIYSKDGQRKYLTGSERENFKREAEKLHASRQNFCLMLYYTGCRISEALALTPESVSRAENGVIIRSLKRRSQRVYRMIPLPNSYLNRLNTQCAESVQGQELWGMSRKTAYRLVKSVMETARIKGNHASPKGLRHGFGIACVENNIPLPTIAKWMGHTNVQTTAIYLNSVGKEERRLAQRLWHKT